jgi:putative flippase GtrA
MIPKDSRLRREFTRFMKFSVVGVIGAIVDFGTFNLLNTLLGVWILLASAISFAAAVTSNFIWNRYWTYPDSRSKPVGQQAAQFALINLIGLAIRTPIIYFAEKPWVNLATRLLPAIPPAFPPGPQSVFLLDPVVLGRNLALATAVVAVLFWNFGINRIWTYSDVS